MNHQRKVLARDGREESATGDGATPAAFLGKGALAFRDGVRSDIGPSYRRNGSGPSERRGLALAREGTHRGARRGTVRRLDGPIRRFVFRFRERAASCNMPAFAEGFRRSLKEKECFAQSAETIWHRTWQFARVVALRYKLRRCPVRCPARHRSRRTERHSLHRQLRPRFLRTGCRHRPEATRDFGFAWSRT